MFACGFHWRQMLRPLFMLSVPVAMLLLATSFWLAPQGQARATEQLEAAFRATPIWGLRAGDFQSLQDDRMVIYVESLNPDGDVLSNVFIHMYRDTADPQSSDQTWTAGSGHYWFDAETGHRYIRLEHGQITEYGKTSGEYRRMRFEVGDLKLPEPDMIQKQSSVAALPVDALLSSPNPEHTAELHWRGSPAIAILLLGLLALPLAHSAPRDGRSGRLVMGLLVYVAYVNLLTLGRVWLVSGLLPPAVGLWWVHAGLLSLVVAWTWAHLRRSTG
jgi:lipopolysaccharide export system permease protein